MKYGLEMSIFIFYKYLNDDIIDRIEYIRINWIKQRWVDSKTSFIVRYHLQENISFISAGNCQ